MNNIWFTSDHHFFHANILRYCASTRVMNSRIQPIQNIEEMHESLIENWNAKIQPNDDVYVLGDFSFGKTEETKALMDRLNGCLHLVRGNHDHKRICGLDRWEWVKDYHELKVPDEEMDLDQVIVMFHYPIESWNKRHHGSFMLHGHCHGTLKSADHMARLDVGVDCHNLYPISYEEVKFLMTKKIFKPVDHHTKETN